MYLTLEPSKEHTYERLGDSQLPFYGKLALGNGTQYTIGAFATHADRLFIGVEDRGAYTFSRYVHLPYVAEKLGLTAGDAACMADFINDQVSLGAARQGNYDYWDRYLTTEAPKLDALDDQTLLAIGTMGNRPVNTGMVRAALEARLGRPVDGRASREIVLGEMGRTSKR